MKPRIKSRWIYGFGVISLASLAIGVMPSYAGYSGQQSGGQRSGGQSDQQGQQAQSQQSQSGSQDGQGWQKVSGFIKKMRKADVGNGDQQNLVVQVQTDQGRWQVIDLGNAEDLKHYDIDRGVRIIAWGKTKTISGRQLLMAKKLKVDGEKITIDRPKFSQQQARQQDQDLEQQDGGQQGQSTREIRGEVVGAGEVVIYDRRGQALQSGRDAFYIVEEPDGYQAELLVGERMDPWLNVGDMVEATVAPDGHILAIAGGSGGSSDGQQMQQSGRGGQDQRNRQDQLSRQQQSDQQREQTARQSQNEY